MLSVVQKGDIVLGKTVCLCNVSEVRTAERFRITMARNETDENRFKDSLL